MTTRPDAHLRGSALLLGGTVLSSAIDFGAQVLLVRYLTRDDFGAWAYALATVGLLATVAQLEMRQVIARFLPAYLESDDRRRAAGAIAFAIGIVLALGVLLALALVVAIGWLGFRPTADAESLRVLVLLAALVPVQAVDGVFTGLFAALGASRAIFLRQSVISPLLRLGLVVGLAVAGAGVAAFAIGTVIVSAIGVAIYVLALVRLLRRGHRFVSRSIEVPAGEMLRFVAPLLSSTLVWILMESSDAILLGFFHDAAAVGAFRVVLPLARMNQLVSTTFSILYLPRAAQALARGDRAAIDELYWKTTTWMTVLTVPILLATTAFASPLTVFLYGPGYAASAPILALLAGAYAFQTVLGFNGLTVKVFGQLRYMIGVDLGVAVLNVALNLALIPALGAIGAAIGTASSLVVHNVLKHIGLGRLTTVRTLAAELRPLYAGLIVLVVAAIGLGLLVPVGIVGALVASALGGAIALVLARHALDIGGLFPEVRLLPLPQWALAVVAPGTESELEERLDVGSDERSVATEAGIGRQRRGRMTKPVQGDERLDRG